MTNTDIGILEYFEDLFGGSIHPTKQQPNRLPAYRWRAHSQLAAEILRCLGPFLKIKYEQAKVAIEFAERIGGHGRVPLSSDEVEARRGLHRDLLRGRSLPYMGAKRKALVDKFGFDAKNAAHSIRILSMGVEYLETGELKVRRTHDRQKIMDIKTGKWSLEEIKADADALFERMKIATASSPLPESIDYEAVNALVVDCMRKQLLA